jgi:hypothetical protein
MGGAPDHLVLDQVLGFDHGLSTEYGRAAVVPTNLPQ